MFLDERSKLQEELRSHQWFKCLWTLAGLVGSAWVPWGAASWSRSGSVRSKFTMWLPQSCWREKPYTAGLLLLWVNSEPSPELPLEIEVIQQNSFNSSSGSKGKVSYPRSLRLQMSLGLLLTLYTPYILPLMIDIRWVCAFGHTEVVAASSSKQLFTAGLSWMPINSILFVSK